MHAVSLFAGVVVLGSLVSASADATPSARETVTTSKQILFMRRDYLGLPTTFFNRA